MYHPRRRRERDTAAQRARRARRNPPRRPALPSPPASLADAACKGEDLGLFLADWYARPSTRYPTVEVRVGDVCLTVADAVLIAALVRGLVTALLRDDRAPAPHVPHWLLAAAHWRASRDGLAAKLFDPQTGTEQPAWTLVDRLAE